ncbi:MAG: hypothetical protein KAJ19_10410, partial [Gammaproteobacteria bacterium]|nr:hypothetical protein [Gammaproteobacteria bacterium]
AKLTGPTVSPKVASGLTKLATSTRKDLIGIALTLKEGRDTAKAGEASNNYREASRRKLAELKSLEGADASGALESYEAWETEWRSENDKNLENNAQRRAFSAKVDPYASSHKDSLAFHAGAEHKKYLDSVAASSIESAKADVATEPFNPSMYKLAIDEGVAAIEAANPGKDNTSLILRFKAETASVKAMSMINVSPDLAGKFIEKEKAVLGGAYVPLKEKLHDAQIRQGSQEETDEIMREVPDPEKQIETARNIKDPELRDATVARIKVRQEEVSRLTAVRDQKIVNGLAKGIDNARSLEAAMDIASNAPKPEMVNELTAYAKAAKSAEITTTQYVALENARARIDNGDITSIEQLGVEYMPVAGKKWESLVKYFNEGGNRGQIKDTTLSTAIQFRKKDFKPKEKEDDAQVLQEIREFVEKNLEPGQFPTDKIVNDLVSTALMSGERLGGGFGYGDNATYIKALKEGHAATWLPDVTDDNEIAEIQELLKNATPPEKATDFNVRLYKRVQMLKLPMTPALRAAYEAQEAKKVTEVGQ